MQPESDEDRGRLRGRRSQHCGFGFARKSHNDSNRHVTHNTQHALRLFALQLYLFFISTLPDSIAERLVPLLSYCSPLQSLHRVVAGSCALFCIRRLLLPFFGCFVGCDFALQLAH